MRCVRKFSEMKAVSSDWIEEQQRTIVVFTRVVSLAIISPNIYTFCLTFGDNTTQHWWQPWYSLQTTTKKIRYDDDDDDKETP